MGVVSNAAGGHVVTTILIAMVAMLFTAVSYGRMARVYPSAGSAFTYAGRELHPLAGYIVGWSIRMDYMLNRSSAQSGAVSQLRSSFPRSLMPHGRSLSCWSSQG